ncbi:MAG: hypothetical protein LUO93_04315 [Methanomicrobiales archaeon]|nr:hypothetical protein [Methanomicrobiales archaeon]
MASLVAISWRSCNAKPRLLGLAKVVVYPPFAGFTRSVETIRLRRYTYDREKIINEGV